MAGIVAPGNAGCVPALTSTSCNVGGAAPCGVRHAGQLHAPAAEAAQQRVLGVSPQGPPCRGAFSRAQIAGALATLAHDERAWLRWCLGGSLAPKVALQLVQWVAAVVLGGASFDATHAAQAAPRRPTLREEAAAMTAHLLNTGHFCSEAAMALAALQGWGGAARAAAACGTDGADAAPAPAAARPPQANNAHEEDIDQE